MQIKYSLICRVTLVTLILMTSVYLSGSQAVRPTQAAVSLQEKPQVRIPKHKAETLLSVPAVESPNNSSPTPTPTPTPTLPQTPIHPYYDLAGAPPSAPGLSMRVRTFSEEPQKIAYLTFDDGPYPQTTPRILKILQDEGVKATFFVLGKQVERYPRPFESRI